MLKCLPIIWPEISKSKSRVESVFNHLSNKAVQQQKVLEFKKQLVSNKALKEYFKQNPVISKVDSIYTIHQTLFEKFGHLSILKVLGT